MGPGDNHLVQRRWRRLGDLGQDRLFRAGDDADAQDDDPGAALLDDDAGPGDQALKGRLGGEVSRKSAAAAAPYHLRSVEQLHAGPRGIGGQHVLQGAAGDCEGQHRFGWRGDSGGRGGQNRQKARCAPGRPSPSVFRSHRVFPSTMRPALQALERPRLRKKHRRGRGHPDEASKNIPDVSLRKPTPGARVGQVLGVRRISRSP